jgi:hypothetical protein
MLLTTIAFAGHAVPLNTEAATAPQPAVPKAKTAEPAPLPTTAATTAAPTTTAAPVGTAAPNVKVAFPAEVNVYLVDTGTREVCDTFSFGGRDFRTECRTEPLRVRAENPALRGICITRYGNRTCY